MTKAVPYGIYDITWNVGWVNVGIDHDTGEFAVESIRRWWLKMGLQSYPKAYQLLVTADSSNNEMKAINLHPHETNGKWNYTISPKLIT